MSCNCSRVIIHDLKSSCRSPCSCGYKHVVSVGVKISKYLFFYMNTLFATFNVKGLNDDAKQKTIFNYLKKKLK